MIHYFYKFLITIYFCIPFSESIIPININNDGWIDFNKNGVKKKFEDPTLSIDYQLATIAFNAKAEYNQQDKNCEVINAGVGGNSTKDLLKQAENDVMALNPDLVILIVATNDMLNSRKMIPFPTYKQNLESIVNTLSKQGKKVLLVGMLKV